MALPLASLSQLSKDHLFSTAKDFATTALSEPERDEYSRRQSGETQWHCDLWQVIKKDVTLQDQIRKFFNIPKDDAFRMAQCCAVVQEDQSFFGTVCLFQTNMCFFVRLERGEIKLEQSIEIGDKCASNCFSRPPRKFKLRHAVLDGRCLSYYKDSESREAYSLKGTIAMDDIHSLLVTECEDRKNCLEILTSRERYVLSFEFPQQLEVWKDAISRRIPSAHLTESLREVIPLQYVKEVEPHYEGDRLQSVSVLTTNGEVINFSGVPQQKKFLKILRQLVDEVELTPSNSQPMVLKNRCKEELLKPKNDISKNIEFHKRFDFSESEYLIEDYSCFMGLVSGHLYISPNFVSFYSSHLGNKRMIVIPIADIEGVLEVRFSGSTIFREGISIQTKEQEFVFRGFSHREEVFDRLQSMLSFYRSAQLLFPVDSGIPAMCSHRDHARLSNGNNVTFLIVGTRGDVQPFIALALGMIKEGFSVKIATHESHRELVESHSLKFLPLAGDPKDLIKLMTSKEFGTIAFFKTAIEFYSKWFSELLVTSWEACKEDTDIIIQNPAGMGGIHIAEKLGIPLFIAFTMPWTRTRAFPHPFGVPFVSLGSLYNYATYLLVDRAMWLPIKALYNDFRTEVLGIPPFPSSSPGPNALLHERQFPFLYCWSPAVLPKPKDWPDYVTVSGYWFLDSPISWRPDPELEEFLASGPPPVYIGFGSMPVDKPDKLIPTITAALEITHQRVILMKSWEGELDLPDSIFVAEDIPHDWLFPRMAAVIHHGGAGTVAAGLRVGKPTCIVPFFGDQMFWARVVTESGAGFSISKKKFTAKRLTSAIWRLVTDLNMRKCAERIGAHIRSQDGVSWGVDFIKRQLVKYRPVVTHG